MEPATATPLRTPPAGVGRPPFPAERRVLEMVSKGFDSREAACLLGLSKLTVDDHMKRMFVRYGWSTRAEATACAVRWGWIP